jgi:hypothetical protein
MKAYKSEYDLNLKSSSSICYLVGVFIYNYKMLTRKMSKYEEVLSSSDDSSSNSSTSQDNRLYTESLDFTESYVSSSKEKSVSFRSKIPAFQWSTGVDHLKNTNLD